MALRTALRQARPNALNAFPGWQQIVIARKRCAASPCASTAQVATAPTGSTYGRDPELQAALDALFADTVLQGRRRVPKEEIQHHIDRIVDLGRRLGLNRVHPDWNDGSFQALVTTNMKKTSSEGVTTLQRLTHGAVQPDDAAVSLGEGTDTGAADQTLQVKGPLAGGYAAGSGAANGYWLLTSFKLLSNGALGRMVVKGQYSTTKEEPDKLEVSFSGYKLEPALSDPQSLSLWREALAEHNPTMDESGTIDISLATQMTAVLFYILMEPDLHITLGTSGDFSVMQRVRV